MNNEKESCNSNNFQNESLNVNEKNQGFELFRNLSNLNNSGIEISRLFNKICPKIQELFNRDYFQHY